MDEKKKCLIIGISGTTNAGKTTVVAKLKQLFPKAQTMCQDSYFLEPDDERLEPYYVPEVDCFNWEQFGALDMERMVNDVEAWKTQHAACGSVDVPMLIIEGFTLFNHSVLAKYFDKKYFFTLDKETCIQRRRHRTYNPPDKPGYFERVVWPMYLHNRRTMEDTHSDILYYDGTEDQDLAVQKMTQDIHQLMKSQSS